MSYAYKIIFDKDKDALNWYDACNSTMRHGVDWSRDIPGDLLAEVRDKPEELALDIIHRYLVKKYIDDKAEIDNFVNLLETSYAQKYSIACQKLEEAMGKSVYIKCLTTYVTTIPQGAYNHNEGYMYDYIGWTDPIAGALHELSHMVFTHYWRDDPRSAVARLTNDQFEWLKESLTVILDDDFLPIIEKIDEGYDVHKKFRTELHDHWKKNHDFQKLVDFGVKLLPNYIS